MDNQVKKPEKKEPILTYYPTHERRYVEGYRLAYEEWEAYHKAELKRILDGLKIVREGNYCGEEDCPMCVEYNDAYNHGKEDIEARIDQAIKELE